MATVGVKGLTAMYGHTNSKLKLIAKASTFSNGKSAAVCRWQAL